MVESVDYWNSWADEKWGFCGTSLTPGDIKINLLKFLTTISYSTSAYTKSPTHLRTTPPPPVAQRTPCAPIKYRTSVPAAVLPDLTYTRVTLQCASALSPINTQVPYPAFQRKSPTSIQDHRIAPAVESVSPYTSTSPSAL